jgi:hypothetical protein
VKVKGFWTLKKLDRGPAALARRCTYYEAIIRPPEPSAHCELVLSCVRDCDSRQCRSAEKAECVVTRDVKSCRGRLGADTASG